MMRRFVLACAAVLLLVIVAGGCGRKRDSILSSSDCEMEARTAADGTKPEDLQATQLLDDENVSWRLCDFPDRFIRQFPTAEESYLILEGTDWENTVVSLRGEGEGAVIYIVAGLHGDEKAGWIAGNLLKEMTLRAGTVYILSPANRYGAIHDQRTTETSFDLNRYFPGKVEGTEAEVIDYAIFTDITEKAPDLVLDLHEARAAQDGHDALENTIICEDVSLAGDLIWNILLAAEDGSLGDGALSLYGSPPMGSINRTVIRELGIPVITVETSREEPLATRVDRQLELAEFILGQYDMR